MSWLGRLWSGGRDAAAPAARAAGAEARSVPARARPAFEDVNANAAADANPSPNANANANANADTDAGAGAGAGRGRTRQLALVIDLDVCVGCQACVTNCKQWNTSGWAGPLADLNPWGAQPSGTFFNRVQTFEIGEFPQTQTVHFPKSCLHCEEPPCVPVCPTGASYKRASDGIVLVDADKCIGCGYCAWACPYGAREMDPAAQVMTKCTLCVDRIEDTQLPPAERQPACVLACPTSARLFGDVHDPDSVVSRAIAERGGQPLMPEWGTRPANRYLPRRGLGPGDGAA